MKLKHILLGCALTALSANAMAGADKTGRGYVGALYTMATLEGEGAPEDVALVIADQVARADQLRAEAKM